MGTTASYYVYILASRRHGTLYIGVTNNVSLGLDQHRNGRGSEFVKKYGVYNLVLVEEFVSPLDAIAREKQLKNLATGLENPTDRREQSRLERSVPPVVGKVVMGPGLRRDDKIKLPAPPPRKLTSPIQACRRNNWRRIFRRIAA